MLGLRNEQFVNSSQQSCFGQRDSTCTICVQPNSRAPCACKLTTTLGCLLNFSFDAKLGGAASICFSFHFLQFIWIFGCQGSHTHIDIDIAAKSNRKSPWDPFPVFHLEVLKETNVAANTTATNDRVSCCKAMR